MIVSTVVVVAMFCPPRINIFAHIHNIFELFYIKDSGDAYFRAKEFMGKIRDWLNKFRRTPKDGGVSIPWYAKPFVWVLIKVLG